MRVLGSHSASYTVSPGPAAYGWLLHQLAVKNMPYRYMPRGQSDGGDSSVEIPSPRHVKLTRSAIASLQPLLGPLPPVTMPSTHELSLSLPTSVSATLCLTNKRVS